MIFFGLKTRCQALQHQLNLQLRPLPFSSPTSSEHTVLSAISQTWTGMMPTSGLCNYCSPSYTIFPLIFACLPPPFTLAPYLFREDFLDNAIQNSTASTTLYSLVQYYFFLLALTTV